jgi:2-polyprenyl-3-methyl-5-hydroxy-6-metoxy-1,4-benzoquinol methylase
VSDNRLQTFYDDVYALDYQGESPQFESYERNWVLKHVYQPKTDCRILDIGAGSGVISDYFRGLGYHVTALEWTVSSVAALQNKGIESFQHDLSEIPFPFPDDTFDEIF